MSDKPDLDDLSRLCEQATPGPWHLVVSGSHCFLKGPDMQPVCDTSALDPVDARLCMEGRNALPTLIAEARAANQLLSFSFKLIAELTHEDSAEAAEAGARAIVECARLRAEVERLRRVEEALRDILDDLEHAPPNSGCRGYVWIPPNDLAEARRVLDDADGKNRDSTCFDEWEPSL